MSGNSIVPRLPVRLGVDTRCDLTKRPTLHQTWFTMNLLIHIWAKLSPKVSLRASPVLPRDGVGQSVQTAHGPRTSLCHKGNWGRCCASLVRITGVTLLWWLGALIVQAASFDHQHKLLDQTLRVYVKAGLVDYARLQHHRESLDEYLRASRAVSESDFDAWSPPQQMAFLINVYNAATLQLILDHYPVKSIKDIGGWFKGPWDQPIVHLWGRTLTLNYLEHDILRRRFQDPRIHFALVCAAKGCPPLRNEAYVAERLDAQLDDQARLFLAQRQKNRVDPEAGVVYLSPLFKWYRKDFEAKAGSLLKALQPYWPAEAAAALAKGRFKIRYTDYDWSLNAQQP